MGICAAMSGAGSTIDVLAGGLLVEYVSWRWIVLVNVPIGIAVFHLSPRVLQESERHRGQLDVPGAVTTTADITLLVHGLTSAASQGWAANDA
jgi:hypothetical protein